MTNKFFGKKLVLPEYIRPRVPPSSAHFNRASREALWEWENACLEIVEFETSEDHRMFFMYVAGRTEDRALMHLERVVRVVELNGIHYHLQKGWRLVDCALNRRSTILHAAVNPPQPRPMKDPSWQIKCENSVEYALEIGKLARRRGNE